MKIEPINPDTNVYAATDDYVHAMELVGPGRLLYVSGTMGLRPDGVAGATLEEQLELIWHNIRTILGTAQMSTDNIVRLTSYLAKADFAEANAAARLKALGSHRVPTTAIVTQLLSPDWMVEIEIIAASGV